jgi:DNA-binding IclR family transcriptional regulator
VSETEFQNEHAASAGSIRSVERALALVEIIASSGDKGSKPSDLVVASKLSKATVHRILVTLTGSGWIEFDEGRGAYFLGPPVVGFGMAAMDRHGIVEQARPHLERLAQVTGDTVYLSVMLDGRALCADRAAGSHPVRIVDPEIGDRRPLGSCAGSLALLAWMDDDSMAESLAAQMRERSDDYRVPERAALDELIEESRVRGYAEFANLQIPEIVGVGVPVRGASSQPVAALSIVGTHSRFQQPRLERIVEWLTEEAQSLSDELLSLNPRFSDTDIKRSLAS